MHGQTNGQKGAINEVPVTVEVLKLGIRSYSADLGSEQSGERTCPEVS